MSFTDSGGRNCSTDYFVVADVLFLPANGFAAKRADTLAAGRRLAFVDRTGILHLLFGLSEDRAKIKEPFS